MFPIDTNKLHLFYVQLEGEEDKGVCALRDDFKFELLLRNLTLKQQLRIRNTKNETDKFIKLLNSLFVQYVVGIYEKDKGQEREPIVELRSKYGKPYLENREYQYNLSDEDGIVMLAIGFSKSFKGKEIGIDLANPVDIERFNLKRLEDFYRSDFKAIFSSAEIENLDGYFETLSHQEQLLLLSKVWSLKESYCKYIGVGITAGMQNFEFLTVCDNFETTIDTIRLKPLKGYNPLNACFIIPNSPIICSVFSHYENARLIKVDACDIINYYTKK